MKFFKYLPLLSFLIILPSCQDDEEPYVPSEEQTKVSTTVLAYFIAENNLLSNEYGANYIQNNLDMMKKGMKNAPKGANFLVYLDDGASPTLFRYVKDKKGNVSKMNLRIYPDQYSTDPRVMNKVISDAFSFYPADSLGLILSSHGSGSLYDSFSYKEMNSDEFIQKRVFGVEAIDRPANGIYTEETLSYTMNITDLEEALRGIPKLQYILFDACLMGNIETAYELRDKAKYYIASPNSTPALGYPYQQIMSSLLKMGAYDLSTVASTYYTYYATNTYAEDDYASTAVLNLEKMESFAQSFDEMLQSPIALQKLERIARKDMQLYEANSNTPTETPSYPLYDISLLIDSIAPTPEIAQSMRSELRKLITFYVHGQYMTVSAYGNLILPYNSNRICGMTVYIPPLSPEKELPYRRYYPHLAWYRDSGLNRSIRYNTEDTELQ